jgi:hypothetical protein
MDNQMRNEGHGGLKIEADSGLGIEGWPDIDGFPGG